MSDGRAQRHELTSDDALAPLSPRAIRLATLFEGVATKTISLGDVWKLWAAADPASAGRPERRADLAQVLRQLEMAGLATLSKKRDVSAQPHLPTRVTLPPPVPSESAATLARAVVWRPELAWTIGARLTVGQVAQLQLINVWLRDRGHDRDVLPLRERSLEILGHEKALDSLLASTVFAPDRLTLDHLRTFQAHPPLPAVQVGDGPVLIVVENDNTFHSVLGALASGPGRVGHVAWGGGGAFEASVRSAGDLAGVREVLYFGDLDAVGLRIPGNAARTAARESLPPVNAAVRLYEALFRTGVRQAGQPALSTERARALAEWLEDDALIKDAYDLLASGVRIPQEALTRTALESDRRWVPG